MKVELRNEIHGGLPPHDDHPYRSGVWRPQYREYGAWDLDVEGEIPDDLAGVYLRNTETAVFEPAKRYHPFDGDGMIHSIGFANGETTTPTVSCEPKASSPSKKRAGRCGPASPNTLPMPRPTTAGGLAR